MANTLKFGNGEWYGKKDTILAYNDLNSNYKPLPFNFSRDSKATVINKDGLIETVGSGQPRIDYKDDSKGALLLEPSRTNLVTYSEDFSQWTKDRVTVSENQIISPNGSLNADLIAENSENNIHRIYTGSISLNDNVNYTITVFAKKGTSNAIQLTPTSTSAIGSGRANFDIENGVLGTVSGGTAEIKYYGNGWYKCSYSFEALATATSAIAVNLINDDLSANRNTTYLGNTNNNVYLWGAQVEQGSYATSYIPTQGSAVTRLADSCSQTVPDGVIGQTEGTMFLDVDFDTLSDLNMFLSIRPNSSNKIEIYRDGNIIYAETASSNSFNISKTNITVGRYKIAFAYSSGSSAMYINGVLIGSNTATFAFTSTLEEIYINSRGTSFIEQSNYNDLKLYNTRLTNAELQALTT